MITLIWVICIMILLGGVFPSWHCKVQCWPRRFTCYFLNILNTLWRIFCLSSSTCPCIMVRGLVIGALPNTRSLYICLHLLRKSDPTNYRIMSLTCISCKLLECRVKDALLKHFLAHSVPFFTAFLVSICLITFCIDAFIVSFLLYFMGPWNSWFPAVRVQLSCVLLQ